MSQSRWTLQTSQDTSRQTSTVPLTLPALPPSLETYFQDGEVSGEEFKQAVKNACVGKNFDEFPNAFRVFILNQFKTVDVNGMCDRFFCLGLFYVICFFSSAITLVCHLYLFPISK